MENFDDKIKQIEKWKEDGARQIDDVSRERDAEFAKVKRQNSIARLNEQLTELENFKKDALQGKEIEERFKKRQIAQIEHAITLVKKELENLQNS